MSSQQQPSFQVSSFVRVFPSSVTRGGATDEDSNNVFKMSDNNITVYAPELMKQSESFVVDRVLTDDSAVPSVVVDPKVKLACEGRNVCFLIYNGGAMPQQPRTLFGGTNLHMMIASALLAVSTRVSLHMSVIEIHSERVLDMLDAATASGSRDEKKFRFLPEGGAAIDGLQVREVATLAQVQDILTKATTTSTATAAATTAPPPHLLVQFFLRRKEPGTVFRSVVTLVDIAASTVGASNVGGGTTCVSSAGSSSASPLTPSLSTVGAVFDSSNKATLSFASLRKCFDQLVEAAKAKRNSPAVPYRQSALTSLISDVFVGNGVVCVVGTTTDSASAVATSESGLSALRFCAAVRCVSLGARANTERAAAAVTEMKHEVEELKRKLELERQARDEDLNARADEVADMEQRRHRLEAEQRAKKAMNAKALASISKQMRSLKSLQTQLSERQSLMDAANTAKLEKRAMAEESSRVQQKLEREAEIAAMREQEVIMQRQIALQLEAQQAVQQKIREDTERARVDLLGREMSFVFRAAAQRTRDEEETAALRSDVEDLRRDVDDLRHQAECRRAHINGLERHVESVEDERTFLSARHAVLDGLLNDGIEARAADIRDARRCLDDSRDRLRHIASDRAACVAEGAALVESSASAAAADADVIARLRAQRDADRAELDALARRNDELIAKRSVVLGAAQTAQRDAEAAAEEVREVELLNARKRQDESIFGEQLADVLRTITAARKRSNQLESQTASLQVQLHDAQQRLDKSDASRNAFVSFLRQSSHASAASVASVASAATAPTSVSVGPSDLPAAMSPLESPARLSRQATPVQTEGSLRAAKRISMALHQSA